MRRSLGLTLALCATLTGLACGASSVTGLAVGGTGNVVVSVGAGTTPTISWTGGNASRLTITHSTGGGVFWDVQALNTQIGFSAPVTFGVVPNGAGQNASSTPLATGTDYRVNVTLVDGSSGTRVFRP